MNRSSASMLRRGLPYLPAEPPAGWPAGASGAHLWSLLQRHLQGVPYAEFAREQGISWMRARNQVYAARAEAVRLGLITASAGWQ